MDEEIERLMAEYEVEEDIAEKALELIDLGLDEDEAIDWPRSCEFWVDLAFFTVPVILF